MDELIGLVVAVDGILQLQAGQGAEYFVANGNRAFFTTELDSIRHTLVKAYRRQYIISGVQEPRFGKVLTALITSEQDERIGAALATLM